MLDSLLFATLATSENSLKILENVPLLRPGKFRLGSFFDGEVLFYLDESVKGKACFVLGHTGPPAENLLQMFTIINTLKLNGAKPIIVIIPYYGYARSDRDKPLQPINSRLFASFLKASGATKVICLDLHSQENEKHLSPGLIHLSAFPLMAEKIMDRNIPGLLVATPDLGGQKRAQTFAQCIGQKNIIVIEKRRPSDTTTQVLKISGDVNNHNIVLVDDMIETGNTLLNAAEALSQKGARDIYACVTHLIPKANTIKLLTSTSVFKKIFVTNSLSNHKTLPTKISEIDILPLLAAAITKETERLT